MSRHGEDENLDGQLIDPRPAAPQASGFPFVAEESTNLGPGISEMHSAGKV